MPPQIELKEKDEEDVKEKSEEKKEEEEEKDEEEEEEEKDKEEQEDEGIELDSNSDSTASHQGQKFIKAVPVRHTWEMLQQKWSTSTTHGLHTYKHKAFQVWSLWTGY